MTLSALIWAIVLVMSGVAAAAFGVVLIARSFHNAPPRTWRSFVAAVVLILGGALSMMLHGDRIGFAFFALGGIVGGTGVLLDISSWSKLFSDTFGPLLTIYQDGGFARVMATLMGITMIALGGVAAIYAIKPW